MATQSPNNHTKRERFSSPIQAVKSLSTEGHWISEFWTQWVMKNARLTMNEASEVTRLTAQGVVEEGKLKNQETKAQEMAEELMQCGSDWQKLMKCAVKLYSKETFLYKVLNEALRNDDMSKVKTLGPLCFLIYSYVSQRYTSFEEQTIYRGMTLTDEMINAYYDAVGINIDWPAFTSTSKNREVAEMFAGNTLCIIKLTGGLFLQGRDISSVSCIPDEEEFLLSNGFVLRVEKVEIDPNKQKHLIYLKSVFDED